MPQLPSPPMTWGDNSLHTLRVYGSMDHEREAIAIELLRRNARAHVLKFSTKLSARKLQSIAEKIGVPLGGSTRGPIPQVSQTYDTEELRLNVRMFAPVYIRYAKTPRSSIDIYAFIKAHDFCHNALGMPIHIDQCWTMARDIWNGNIHRIECKCGCTYFACHSNTQQRCPKCRVAGDGKIVPNPNVLHQHPVPVPAGTMGRR